MCVRDLLDRKCKGFVVNLPDSTGKKKKKKKKRRKEKKKKRKKEEKKNSVVNILDSTTIFLFQTDRKRTDRHKHQETSTIKVIAGPECLRMFVCPSL